jgi:type I restriction enzyme S subunit
MRIDALAQVDPENLPNSTGPKFVFNYISLDHVDAGRLLGYSRESFATAPSRARRVLRTDDVLMSTVRPALQGHLLFSGQVSNAVCSTGFAVLRTKRHLCDPRFLFAHLFGDEVGAQVQKLLAGSNYPAINSGDVGKLRVTCPPTVAEQRAIAAVLSDVDALIGSLETLIAKKRAIKRAAMQQLLSGRTRLPGFEGEWEVRRLGDLARVATGTRNNQDKRHDGQYPFFVRSSSIERIDSFGYDCEAILIPGEGRIGEIFHYVRGRFDVHQRVYAITDFGSSVFGRFLYYYMAEHFGAHALKNTVKATVDSLRQPTFLVFQVPLPPPSEQRAIAAVLTDMDEEIAVSKQRLAKTRAIKQGMMQQLLTGAVRLPIPDDGLEGESHDA